MCHPHALRLSPDILGIPWASCSTQQNPPLIGKCLLSPEPTHHILRLTQPTCPGTIRPSHGAPGPMSAFPRPTASPAPVHSALPLSTPRPPPASHCLLTPHGTPRFPEPLLSGETLMPGPHGGHGVGVGDCLEFTAIQRLVVGLNSVRGSH